MCKFNKLHSHYEELGRGKQFDLFIEFVLIIRLLPECCYPPKRQTLHLLSTLRVCSSLTWLSHLLFPELLGSLAAAMNNEDEEEDNSSSVAMILTLEASNTMSAGTKGITLLKAV